MNVFELDFIGFKVDIISIENAVLSRTSMTLHVCTKMLCNV